MKRIIILLLCTIMNIMVGMAQDGYKVSGRIAGVPDGPLLLMSFEHNRPDTLGVAYTNGGNFEFTGEVKGVMAAYITTVDRKGAIPLILEDTVYTVTVGNDGITIRGGEAQAIFNRFGEIRNRVREEEIKMKEAYSIARQEGNSMKMQALQNQFGKIMGNARKEEEGLLEEYADSYVTAYVIASSMKGASAEILKAKYNLLSENARNTVPGRSIARLIAQVESVAVGHPAPDFTLQTPEGDSLTLKNVKGKVKLIDFWASWCAPCRQENVNLLKIYRKYQPAGLEIISISLDHEKQKWTRAIGEDGNIWLNASDLKGQHSEVASTYFVRNIPHTLLLDENNVIIAKDIRGEALRKKIAELLKMK